MTHMLCSGPKDIGGNVTQPVPAQLVCYYTSQFPVGLSVLQISGDSRVHRAPCLCSKLELQEDLLGVWL